MEQYNVEQGRAGSRDFFVAELLEQAVNGSILLPRIHSVDKIQLQQLLDHGAALDGLPDHFHTTESPLLVAVQNDAFHLADSLVSHSADLNFTTLSCGHLTLSNPTTTLGHVIASNARNSIARLRYLLGSASMRDGLHLIVEPIRQWTALHRAAAAHIDVEFRGTDAAEAVEC
ncbi:hypothetical protein BKA60DRAFT_644588 [Fusarium oxysporum]|nr:hypothetical protein BKA60DRAFT_644588 [Fusarium oxysporum]